MRTKLQAVHLIIVLGVVPQGAEAQSDVVQEEADALGIDLPVANFSTLPAPDQTLVARFVQDVLRRHGTRVYRVGVRRGRILVVAGGREEALRELLRPAFDGDPPIDFEGPGRGPAAVDEIHAYQMRSEFISNGEIVYDRVWSEMITLARSPHCALDLRAESEARRDAGSIRVIASHPRNVSGEMNAPGRRLVYRSTVTFRLERSGPDSMRIVVEHSLEWRRESSGSWNSIPGSEVSIGSPSGLQSAPPTVSSCVDALSVAFRQ